jgi:hypothetical protein
MNSDICDPVMTQKGINLNLLNMWLLVRNLLK